MQLKKHIALVICGGIMGSMITFLSLPFFSSNIIVNKTYLEKPISTINIEGKTNNIYKAIIKKAMPSVVGITTKAKPSLEKILSGEAISSGVGTGVIIDSKGYIVTNSHVVNDGAVNEVNIIFNDSTTEKAEVLWFDKHLDLAIVKTDIQGLIQAELGDSDKVEVGDISVAIGNPFGMELQRTATEGIISGLNRTVNIKNKDNTITSIKNLIQTSAAINLGNSGGPLLNEKGQVIGINTAKAGQGEGLGFAIPINEAKPIIQQFIEKGQFKKTRLGVTISDVLEYQEMTGTDFGIKSGAIILQIEEKSVAQKNNLQVNDVITKINEQEINVKSDLLRYLYKIKTGDIVKMTIWRNKKSITLNVQF